jgi:hypothetical protein
MAHDPRTDLERANAEPKAGNTPEDAGKNRSEEGERASAAAATGGGGHPQQVDVTARGEQG